MAKAHDLPFSDAYVVGGHSNTMVQLRPHPVIARVATGTSEVRSGTAWLAREVAIARFLAEAGAPAVRPSTMLPPGPHEHDGLALSFWALVEATDREVPPRDAGVALRACHQALEGFSGELPRMAAIEEAKRLLAHPRIAAAYGAEVRALLATALERIDAHLAGFELRVQPLHGDAHPGNLWSTAEGPIWGDWEDTFAGPREWDLACLVGSSVVCGEGSYAAAALDGYGAPIDAPLLDLLIEARSAQALVWSAVLQAAPLESERVRARLAWLERRQRWSRGRP